MKLNIILGVALTISVIANIIDLSPSDIEIIDNSTTTIKEVDGAELTELKKKYAELEATMQKKDNYIASLQSQNQPKEKPEQNQSYAQRLANLKENNPELYKRIQENKKRFQEKMEKKLNTSLNFLDGFDTSRLSEAEKEKFATLSEKMKSFEGIQDRIAEATPEERQEIFAELRQDKQEVNELMTDVRNIALDDFAESIGYEGNQVKQVSKYIDSIYKATSTGRGGPGRGRK